MIKQWKNEAPRMSKLTKRTISALLILCMTFAFSGCGKKEVKKEEKEVSAISSIDGTLVSFSGKDITIEADGQDYTFDVSKATVNTENMLAGTKL